MTTESKLPIVLAAVLAALLSFAVTFTVYVLSSSGDEFTAWVAGGAVSLAISVILLAVRRTRRLGLGFLVGTILGFPMTWAIAFLFVILFIGA